MITTIIMVVFALLTVGAIAWYYFKFYGKIAIINSDVKKAAAWLNTLPEGDNDESNERFYEIDAELQKNDSIASVWQDFRKTLTIYTNEDGIQTVYSITDASDYFSYPRFTYNLNMSFWQNYGGIFTGLGILGTFAGLTFGLYGIDMASSDIEVLKKGIAGLLEGVQFAFLTSLVGISVALFYGFIHNKQIKSLKDNIERLSVKIEHLFGRRTAEEWLAIHYEESKSQTKTLNNLSEDVARDLNDLLNEQLNNGIKELCERLEEKMTPIFDKLNDSINELGAGGAESIGQLISDKAGKQIDQFADSLQDLQEAMRQNIESSQQVASEMNQQMLTTVKNMSDANNTAYQQMGQTLANIQESIAQNIASSRETNENINKQMREVMDNVGSSLILGANEAAYKQQETSDLIQAQMKETIETVKTIAQNTAQSLNDMINTHNDSLKTTFERMREFSTQTENMLKLVKDSGKAIKDATEPLNAAASELKQQIELNRKDNQELRDSITMQINAVNKANADITQNLKILTEGIKSQNQELKEAWEKYGQSYDNISGELAKSTDIVTERLQSYNKMMNDGMKDTLAKFDKSVNNAAGALKAVVEELQDVMYSLPQNN